MESGNEDKKNHETSQSPKRRLHCHEISTGKNSNDTNIGNIPIDLVVEIFKKLPGKSLMRFLCLSKQLSSIISYNRNFIDSILTRPSRHTDLIVHYYMDRTGKTRYCFLSSNTDKELVSIPGVNHQYVRGLIYCLNSPCAASIYNTTTRQSVYLPVIKPLQNNTFFFGYDPIENQYKLVSIQREGMKQSCQVFTLGDPTAKEWRNIECSIGLHFPRDSPVFCINGAIYYRAAETVIASALFLVSFDVRFEKFDHVKSPKTPMMNYNFTLINYLGKLGFTSRHANVMQIWVMEDGEKTQEWSNILSFGMNDFDKWRTSGVTSDGKIVFVDHHNTFFLYYDPNHKYRRYVHINPQGILNTSVITKTKIITDHVENTMCLY